MTKFTIWTTNYSPFRLGPPEGIIYTEVECSGPYELGLGFFGILAVDPKTGRTYVAEKTSGAIVGNSISQCKDDIRSAEPPDGMTVQDFIKEQINRANAQWKRLPKERLSPEEFFARMEKAK